MELTPELITTIVGAILTGIGGIWYLVSKVIVPARIETEREQLEAKIEAEREQLKAEIEASRDNREHKQRLGQLESMYHQSEQSVAQQNLAVILQANQDNLNEFYAWIRKDVMDSLNRIEHDINIISTDIIKFKYEMRRAGALLTMITSLIQEKEEKKRTKKRQTEDLNERDPVHSE